MEPPVQPIQEVENQQNLQEIPPAAVEAKKSSRKGLFILVAIVVLGLAMTVLGFYFVVLRGDEKEEGKVTGSTLEIEHDNVDVSSVRVLFKSETDTYLEYKYTEYDIATGQVKYLSLPGNFTSKLRLSPDMRTFFIATRSAIYIASSDSPDNYKKIYSLPQTSLVNCNLCEKIQELDSLWSSDGSQIGFVVRKYKANNSNEPDINTFITMDTDGTVLKQFDLPVSERLEIVQAYDAKEQELYYTTFDSDPDPETWSSNPKTVVLDTNTGATKRDFPFIDDENFGDIYFRSDLAFLLTTRRDDQFNLQIVKYNIESGIEEIVYDSAPLRGLLGIKVSSTLDSVVFALRDSEEKLEYYKLDIKTGRTERLYDNAEIAFVPMSISPDGNYLWTRSEDYRSKTYQVFDISKKKWIQVKPPDNLVLKIIPLGKIFWLP